MKLNFALALICLVGFVFGQNDPDCGVKLAANASKPLLGIYGGAEVSSPDYPWHGMIAIFSPSLVGEPLFYGGNIINKRWILTSAQAVTDPSNGTIRDLSKMFFYGGKYARKNESTQQDRRISLAIRHPSYNAKTLEGDLALLKLDANLNLSAPALGSICLPDGSQSVDSLTGTKAVTVGWGLYDIDSSE